MLTHAPLKATFAKRSIGWARKRADLFASRHSSDYDFAVPAWARLHHHLAQVHLTPPGAWPLLKLEARRRERGEQEGKGCALGGGSVDVVSRVDVL